jgi:hypothetical protein
MIWPSPSSSVSLPAHNQSMHSTCHSRMTATIAIASAGSPPPCCGKFSVTQGAIPLDNIAGDQGLPTSAVAAYNSLPIDTQVQAGQSLSLPCGRVIALVAPQLGGGGSGSGKDSGGGGKRKVLGGMTDGGGGGGSSGSPQVFMISEPDCWNIWQNA